MGCYCEKSTQTAPVVVQLDLFFTYNEKHQVKEKMIMNTDKIYAEQLANKYAPKNDYPAD